MNLVYDRTQVDADAALKAVKSGSWTGDMKGGYNASDMNRVQSAVSALSAELTAAGYIHSVDIHADWANGDVMKLSDWAQYLANVQALRDAFYTLAETGELPAATDKLGWQGANTIEKILADIDLLIGWMKSSYRRCGTFNSGENSITLPLKGSV